MTTPPIKRRRYIVRFEKHGRYDNGSCWAIYDRERHFIVESGYSQRHAWYIANWYNYRHAHAN